MINRYLDFFTLCLICNCVILLLEKIGLFRYNDSLSAVLEREPYMTSYESVSFGQAIAMAVQLESYNGALWMIRLLFIGNLIVYALSFWDSYFKKYSSNCLSCLFVVCLRGFLLKWSSPIIYVTVIGGHVRMMNKEKRFYDYLRNNCRKGFKIALLLLLMLLSKVAVEWAHRYVAEMVICSLLCFVFLAVIEGKEVGFLSFLGRCSIALFSTHMPIIYSIGSMAYIGLYSMGIKDRFVSRIIIYVLNVLFIIVFAEIHDVIVETPRREILRKIRKYLFYLSEK